MLTERESLSNQVKAEMDMSASDARLLCQTVERMAEGRSPRIGILTSNFHLYRARLIAEKQGLEDVCGIAAESDRVMFVHFCLRDGLALLKDRLMGNL